MQPQKPLLAFGEDNEKEFKTGKHSQEVEQGKSGPRVVLVLIFGCSMKPIRNNPASRDFSSETNQIPLWVKPD